jgi:CRISPR/Cas system-associated exonuclease Cas4 (RecB family)
MVILRRQGPEFGQRSLHAMAILLAEEMTISRHSTVFLVPPMELEFKEDGAATGMSAIMRAARMKRFAH